jgi:hypothetical protein
MRERVERLRRLLLEEGERGAAAAAHPVVSPTRLIGRRRGEED